MTGATITLLFDDAQSETEFVRDYLADAWPRFEASEFWDHGWFWRYGQFAEYDAGPDGGCLRLVFDGDPDALLDAETERWAAFNGLDAWECERYDERGDDSYESLRAQQRDAKGTVGGEREYRFKALTARLALAYYREFDDPLPAAPPRGAGEDDPLGIGMWALLHDLLVQCGYDQYDETDIALRMLENRLKSVAGYYGADAAREEYERIREAWEEHEAALERWLSETPTGDLSVP